LGGASGGQQAFLDKVKQLLTVPDSGYMAREYEGNDAYINARAMVITKWSRY
jgi:hypothetical protein